MHLGCASFASHPPLCVQDLGFKDVPPAGHALRAEVGGGHYFCFPWEFAGQHKKLPVSFVVDFCGFYCFKLYTLAMVGRPSLHGYDACVVSWVSGAYRRNCRQKTW